MSLTETAFPARPATDRRRMPALRLASDVLRGTDRLWRLPDRVFLVAATVVALILRVPRLGIRYWGDEAITVGIASRPLHEIPLYLRFDGSPPLYYVILHWWMALFGTSEVATHSLSLMMSLIAIPVAWWCAATLFGPRAAKPAALLAAVFPYLTYYGTETRMYVLVGILSMVALTAWARALQAPAGDASLRVGVGWRRWLLRGDPGRRWLGLAIVASAAVLYTHDWGLFLVAVFVAVGAGCAWVSGARVLGQRTVVYAVAVTLAYVPWLPSFWRQLRSTGAPWSPHPSVGDLIVDPFNVAFSAAWPAGLFGLIVGVIALNAVRPRRPSLALDGQTELERRPVSRWIWAVARSPLAVSAVIVVATALMGWVVAQFVHSWAPRYLGVALVPGIVVMAGVFTATQLGRRVLVVASTLMAATALPVLFDPPAASDSKSNVAMIDEAVRGRLAPGDLVITTALSELPVIAYYLPVGLHYATPIGLVPDPRVVDWKDLPERLSAADPVTGLATLLSSVPVGGHVLLVNPLSWVGTETPPQYQAAVEAEGIAVSNDVLQDPDYAVIQTIRPSHPSHVANPVEGILLRRTG